MARTTLICKWSQNRQVGFQKAVFFDTYSRLIRTWLIPIIFWISLFSIYRSIYPMAIHTRFPPVDVITVLSNSPPIYFGNNNDTRSPSNAITAIMEDIYMRNEKEYLNKIEYSTIIVQPVLTLEEDLSLTLVEGFYNFHASSIEFPEINIETKIRDKLHKDDNTALVTYTNDLLKLISLPRYSYANENMFKNRKLSKIASIGLSVASVTTMICYFSIQIFSNIILHYVMISIFPICSIVGAAFSIFNIVMVGQIFDNNYRYIFDLLIFIIAIITNIYLIVSLVLCLISSLLIIEGDLENQIEDYHEKEAENDVDESSEFRFTAAPFNLFCRKQSGQETRALPLYNHKKSSNARPKSETSNANKSPDSTGRARSATAPSGLQGINLFGSANSDEDSILLNSIKHPNSNTSRFAESV